MDLTKSVVEKVWLKGYWYNVKYEGLHSICTTCGIYGHLVKDCTKKHEGNSSSPTQDSTKVDTESSSQAMVVPPIGNATLANLNAKIAMEQNQPKPKGSTHELVAEEN